MAGNLTSFEPNPPGVPRVPPPVGTLGPTFSSSLSVYQDGAGGQYRLLMSESYGYSILNLANPLNPTALLYHDIRYPRGGPNSVTHHGDGQSDVAALAVSSDGHRAIFSTAGPAAPFQTVVGNHGTGYGFTLWGDFYPDRAQSTVVQKFGTRYIAYDVHQSLVAAADITTLPTGRLVVGSMASETTGWPGGYLGSLAGDYLLYMSSGIQIVNVSNPGPVGHITAGFPRTTITNADFGGRVIAYYSAAVDPFDPAKLWVLVELNAKSGENSPSYSLVSVSSGLIKRTGPIWRVPSLAGEAWSSNPGVSSALIPSNGNLFVFMWAQRTRPTALLELYSTTAGAWSSVNSVPPGKFDIPTNLYGDFSVGFPMAGFSSGTSVYAYLPTGRSAYVIPMVCTSSGQ